VDRSARKVPAVASHGLSQVLNEVVTDSLFEIAGSDVFVKVDDLLVQSVCVSLSTGTGTKLGRKCGSMTAERW